MKNFILGALVFAVLQLLAGVLYLKVNPGYYKADEILPKFRSVPSNPIPVYNAIIRLRNAEDQFFCSGSVIDATYALTAAHCVNYMAKNEVIRIYDQYDSYTGVDATVVGYNDRNDTAVIKGEFKNFKAVAIEKDRHGFIASEGPFLTCGFPYGNKNLYCSYALKVSTENFAMRLKGALIPGMSGGPVYDLNTNKVVGVNSAVEGSNIIVYPITGVLASFGLE